MSFSFRECSVLQLGDLCRHFVRECLIRQYQIRKPRERNHFHGERSFVTDFVESRKQRFEIDHAFEQVIAEAVQTAGAVRFLKVFEVNRLDVAAEDFGEILRTAGQACVAGVEVNADVF